MNRRRTRALARLASVLLALGLLVPPAGLTVAATRALEATVAIKVNGAIASGPVAPGSDFELEVTLRNASSSSLTHVRFGAGWPSNGGDLTATSTTSVDKCERSQGTDSCDLGKVRARHALTTVLPFKAPDPGGVLTYQVFAEAKEDSVSSQQLVTAQSNPINVTVFRGAVDEPNFFSTLIVEAPFEVKTDPPGSMEEGTPGFLDTENPESVAVIYEKTIDEEEFADIEAVVCERPAANRAPCTGEIARADYCPPKVYDADGCFSGIFNLSVPGTYTNPFLKLQFTFSYFQLPQGLTPDNVLIYKRVNNAFEALPPCSSEPAPCANAAVPNLHDGTFTITVDSPTNGEYRAG